MRQNTECKIVVSFTRSLVEGNIDRAAKPSSLG